MRRHDPRGADDLEQVVLRIALERGSDLADERLHGERVRNVRHRSEPADTRVRDGLRILDPDVGDREGHVDDAHPEFPVRFLHLARVEGRHDRRRDAPVQPRDRVTLRVDAGLEMLHRDSVEVVVVKIVVARPDDLDRPAIHRFRQDRRLDAVIRLGLATEAPAEQCHVDGDILDGHAEPLGDEVARRLRRLEAALHLAFAVDDAGRCGRRLHRRVREMRQVVLRLDPLRSAGHRRRHVPFIAHDLAGLGADASSVLR